ncbi:SET domain-containing protein [Sistotremastrum suecicum HHB10207 ss-3]|uniref:SET domain-containing protein n=1 Tax=Sistotremastrum suecicum HHB10207 ss-3 TaxID=1314776 RepID=A0A166FWP8_9AGAM|nr:SET domain-containing protein [Sistotremastrum suecicum HHB10207 ss-3]
MTMPPPSKRAITEGEGNDDEFGTECIFRYSLKEHIFSYPHFPSPIPRPEKPAYEIRESPGKGVGMYALRALSAGELIIAERPMLLGPPAVNVQLVWRRGFTHEDKSKVSLLEWEKLLETVFKRMPPENQKAYMELANSHTHDGSGPLLGRFRTNGLGIDTLIDPFRTSHAIHSGICKDISRVNHSCGPNAGRAFDVATFCFELRAARPISAGEEITIHYCSVMDKCSLRQDQLKPYGFRCTCSSCANHIVSDKRRASLHSLAPLFMQWMQDRSLPGDYVIKECLRLIAVIKEEGLETHPLYREYLELISKCYDALGDVGQSVSFLRQLKLFDKVNKSPLYASYALKQLGEQLIALSRARVPPESDKKKKKKSKKKAAKPADAAPEPLEETVD